MRKMSRAQERAWGWEGGTLLFKGEIEIMATNDLRILSERISHFVGFIGLKLLELLTCTANDECK